MMRRSRIIEERSEKLGQIVAWLLGTAWTLMTYFVVPVLVFEEHGVVDSVKRSTGLFKETWGKKFASSFSFGLIWIVALLIQGAFGAPRKLPAGAGTIG